MAIKANWYYATRKLLDLCIELGYNMNTEEIREYCLSKHAATEGMPFGDSVIVFKILGKIFLLLSLEDTPIQFNVKCDPENANELREKYECVKPGYHMNKKHWNTIIVDYTVDAKLLKKWIDDSYNLIVDGLPKRDKTKLQNK